MELCFLIYFFCSSFLSPYKLQNKDLKIFFQKFISLLVVPAKVISKINILFKLKLFFHSPVYDVDNFQHFLANHKHSHLD